MLLFVCLSSVGLVVCLFVCLSLIDDISFNVSIVVECFCEKLFPLKTEGSLINLDHAI